MIGQTLSHYRILNKIGAGGMGEVYLAEDDRLGRKLALKILPEQFMQDEDRVRRFEQEARAASALNHPNIITIYEIGHETNLHFIATEYIEGTTLRKRLLEGRLPLDEALEIAIQAAGALHAAHTAGIIHRDIKPENIMLRPDGYVKVLDFGLAKLTEQGGQDTGEVKSPSLETKSGLIMGTAAYMSPEQARGQRVDGRTDQFSLGVVLYEMVTGRRPFTGETTSDILVALLTSTPPRVSESQPAAPPELETILDRMLAKDSAARYASAQEIVTALRRAKARLEFSEQRGQTVLIDSAGGASAEEVATAPLAPKGALAAETQPSYETNLIPREVTTQSSAPPVPPGARNRVLTGALVILALLGGAALYALRFTRTEATRIDSIAVLPLVNANNDPDADYLSEGITEGIINTLSQWPALSVSARNSVIRYKGREADAQAVGRDLDVKAVLIGRIARRGDELTINAELVDARNGRQVWGERFVRRISDLMAVQDEIAQKITDKLQLRLQDAGPSAETAAQHATTNPEAYDLYLKGRYFWNKGTIEDKHKADEYFEAAFGKDPSYALAAAGCAACHVAGSDGEPPEKAMAKARLVAEVALKKNDALADPHLTLAQVRFRYDWDFAGAEREFLRALQLDPRNAQAYLRYSEFLALLGRRKESLNQLTAARRLDPRSLPVNQAFGTLSYYSKDYRDATRHLRDTLVLDDNFAPAHTALGLAFEQQGQTQEAVLEYLRAQSISSSDPDRVTALKKAFTEQGRDAFWREYLSQLDAEAKSRYIPSSMIAAVQVRLGQHDLALQALEKGFTEKDGGLVELKAEPVFDPLRANAKFGALLRKVGLTQ